MIQEVVVANVRKNRRFGELPCDHLHGLIDYNLHLGPVILTMHVTRQPVHNEITCNHNCIRFLPDIVKDFVNKQLWTVVAVASQVVAYTNEWAFQIIGQIQVDIIEDS